MKKFELLLKNEKIKSYDRISLYIILINLALFILSAIQSEEKKMRITGITGSAVIIALLLIQYFFIPLKKERANIYSYACMLVAALVWFIIGKWAAGILCIILLLLHQISKRQLLVSVNAENIRYASFPARSIPWSELNNTILKDGILTIDFKNNKILQAEIIDSGNAINEKEFNDFCRQQLKNKNSS